MNVLPWVIYPYLVVCVFVVGHVWRWRHDQLGITSKSSQLLERKWLLRGSIPFHLGLLGVMAGHVVGLLVPQSLTAKVGMSEHVYHLQAVVMGGAMGVICWVGIVILTCRRLFVPAVRRAGNLADIVTDLMLLTVITLGNCLTIGYQLFVHEYNYRETVSVWVRQLPLFHPDPSIMSSVPWIYQVHILAALTLFAFWPFSRLVHVWTAPLQYVIRSSHILYRRPVGAAPRAEAQ
jgi:nitrate reductase gamma subunit